MRARMTPAEDGDTPRPRSRAHRAETSGAASVASRRGWRGRRRAGVCTLALGGPHPGGRAERPWAARGHRVSGGQHCPVLLRRAAPRWSWRWGSTSSGMCGRPARGSLTLAAKAAEELLDHHDGKEVADLSTAPVRAASPGTKASSTPVTAAEKSPLAAGFLRSLR